MSHNPWGTYRPGPERVRAIRAAVRRAPSARGILQRRLRLPAGALSGHTDPPLSAPPDGPGAPAMRAHIIFDLHIRGRRDEPFPEGHFILVSMQAWPIRVL